MPELVRRALLPRAVTSAVVLLCLALAVPGARAGYRPPTRYAGSYQHAVQTEPTGSYDYWTYTPSTYRASRPAPLVVVVHGCNTTAVEQINANVAEPMAERNGVVLVYPDFRNEADPAPDSGESTNESLLGTHPARCWRFYDVAGDTQRGLGDPAAVADITRAVMAKRRIDPNRVYVVGMSSGAMLTSVLGATYPDLYAAIGVVAGCAYLDGGTCWGRSATDPDTAVVQGQAAAAEMGAAARVVPVIDIQGDSDGTVPPRSGFTVMRQWMTTANVVTTGTTSGPFPLEPTSTTRGRVPGGRAYTTFTYRGPHGCLAGQHVYVHGMGHFWPGGSRDKTWYEWEDPTAPNGVDLTWSFFRRFTRTSTGGACTERERD
jgi:poly(hydroxyalkanoate) depolymerase family esterase